MTNLPATYIQVAGSCGEHCFRQTAHVVGDLYVDGARPALCFPVLDVCSVYGQCALLLVTEKFNLERKIYKFCNEFLDFYTVVYSPVVGTVYCQCAFLLV